MTIEHRTRTDDAAFWHILWIAGVAILMSAVVGVAVHSAGYAWLELDGV